MLQSHTPPIAASPARLGLSAAANSPALPTNPKPPPSAAPIPSSAPTSAALLSLLPPLPRAQSLLLQLSSLSTHLFSVSPHRAQWLAAYRGSLPSFLSSPTTPTPAPTPPPSSTKEVLTLFDSLQSQLFDAVSELQQILDLKDSRLKIARDIRAKDATLLAFARKLKEAEEVLDRLVDDYSDYRCKPKRSKPDEKPYSASLHSSLDLDDILAYAHRTSYTTFAPPEHGAGLAPLRGALPPAPQDNEMRASQLYHFADLDVGVPPKMAAEAKNREADVPVVTLMEPTPPREELAPPVARLLPGWKGLPIELPPVPPGWKPGDPVPLPSIPPGWKPGDPVPLPPFDNKGVDQQMAVLRSVPPAVPQQKAPEAIQVSHVQLDINDDSSSGYSSEVGSSDEDDED